MGSEPNFFGHFLDLLLSNDPALISKVSLAPNFSMSDHSSIIFVSESSGPFLLYLCLLLVLIVFMLTGVR